MIEVSSITPVILFSHELNVILSWLVPIHEFKDSDYVSDQSYLFSQKPCVKFPFFVICEDTESLFL